ncbi:type II toxin-antitoxin system RelE family toxin [Candidatus Pyrohabitans sp.]
MAYRVLIDREALEYVNSLPEKKQRIVKRTLKAWRKPYPGFGKGDKEKLIYKGEYRLHIGRTFTTFYRVYDEEKEVRILKVMTIEKAHKEYGMM